MTRQRDGNRAIIPKPFRWAIPEVVVDNWNPQAFCRGGQSGRPEYRVNDGILTGWEVHHGRFVRLSQQAALIGPP